MARYQVVLAYDGTKFAGFQRLNPAGKTASRRTVQGEVETTLRGLGWTGQSIFSAGRTDTGVHAAGQVIAFDLAWNHSNQDLCQALNACLPLDVSARSVEIVSDEFHPRYDARSRRYCYQIFCQSTRDPLRERYAWRVWPPAAEQRMAESAALLVGAHDFAAFGSPPHPGGSTQRVVWKAGWRPSVQGCSSSDGLQFEITGNAFLYHMVRRLVFIQVQVGQGRLTLNEMAQAIETGVLSTSGLAPAQGLVLVEVSYSDELNF